MNISIAAFMAPPLAVGPLKAFPFFPPVLAALDADTEISPFSGTKNVAITKKLGRLCS